MHQIFVLQAIMASQSLTEILKSISKDWISYRKASESLSKTGAKIRTVNKNHYMYDLIIHDWSNKISERVNLKNIKVSQNLVTVIYRQDLGLQLWIEV